jgi:hypothetical protein
MAAGLRAHVMLYHNHYDLMAFTTPGESSLRYRQDSRRVSYGHENVAVTKEPPPQLGHAINLHAIPCGGNSGPTRQEVAGVKGREPTGHVLATLA